MRPRHYFSKGSSKPSPTTGRRTPNLFFPGWTSCLPACDRSMSTKPRNRSLTSSSAIFPITTRSRSAHGSLLFFGAETWSILSAPPGPPAKCVSSNSGWHRGDAQPKRACCYWRDPDHTWRPWRTEKRHGRSSGSRRGIQQSWSRGGGNHHFNRQQQQQQPRPPPKPLTAKFGLGGPFDGGTNAGGWPQEESPLSPDGSAPHCERCGRKGHVASICRAPSRFEGICDTCGQYDHRVRYCIQNQPAPHAHVVAVPVAPLAPSAPAFSAPPTGGSG